MSKLLIPNTTQVPNVILDEVIPKLTSSPVRVLLAIIRLTYGFQKSSDRISQRSLAKKTGLSRRNVIKGVKALDGIIQIIPGKKGLKTWEGANEYSLNLDISTGLLEGLTRAQTVTCVQNVTCDDNDQKGAYDVSKSSHSQTNKIKPILRASKKSTPKPVKGDSPGEGFKEAMALYQDLFVAKVGAKPDIDGRDGKILSGLLRGHGAEEVQRLLKFFFKSPPAWVVEKGKYTMPTFKGLYSELLAQAQRQQSSMRNIG